MAIEVGIDGKPNAHTSIPEPISLRTYRRHRLLAAVLTIMVLSACGDDLPSEDAPSPAGDDGGSDGGSDGTLEDPDVALSNVPNEPEAPLDPAGS